MAAPNSVYLGFTLVQREDVEKCRTSLYSVNEVTQQKIKNTDGITGKDTLFYSEKNRNNFNFHQQTVKLRVH